MFGAAGEEFGAAAFDHRLGGKAAPEDDDTAAAVAVVHYRRLRRAAAADDQQPRACYRGGDGNAARADNLLSAGERGIAAFQQIRHRGAAGQNLQHAAAVDLGAAGCPAAGTERGPAAADGAAAVEAAGRDYKLAAPADRHGARDAAARHDQAAAGKDRAAALRAAPEQLFGDAIAHIAAGDIARGN